MINKQNNNTSDSNSPEPDMDIKSYAYKLYIAEEKAYLRKRELERKRLETMNASKL